LISYAAAYPKKIPGITVKVDRIIKRNLRSTDRKNRLLVLVGMRIYTGLVKKLHAEGLGYLLSSSIQDIISLLFTTHDLNLVEAASDLLMTCTQLDKTANYSSYISIVLQICYSSKDFSEDPINLFGMKLLNLLIENLLIHPGELDTYLKDIVEVCFFHLLSKYKPDSKDKVCALREEVLSETAEACHELFIQASSGFANVEVASIVCRSWQCVCSLAKFPSAPIERQVLAAVLEVFGRYQATYQRNCANSSLHLLLVEMLYLVEKTALAVNLLSLPVASALVAHMRSGVFDSTRILSSQAAVESAEASSHSLLSDPRSSRPLQSSRGSSTQQLGSELVIRSLPALLESVHAAAGFLLFWAKMEHHTSALMRTHIESEQQWQLIRFGQDLSYRVHFSEIVKQLFDTIAFVLRTASTDSQVAAVTDGLALFRQKCHCMPPEPCSPLYSKYLLEVYKLSSTPSEEGFPEEKVRSDDGKLAQIVATAFQYVELVSRRHITLNIYFSEIVLDIFLNFGTIESENLFLTNSELIHSYRLCVFAALFIVLFNSTDCSPGTLSLKGAGRRDLFTQEYLPLSVKFLFNTAALVKESGSWRVLQFFAMSLLGVLHNTHPPEDDVSSGIEVGHAGISSSSLFVNKWFPFSSAQIGIIHDFIFDSLTSEDKLCQEGDSHSLYLCTLWNLEMALLERFGVAEVLRVVPLLLALLDHWGSPRYKLASTVTSSRSTNFAGLEETIECLACQKMFFVLVLLFASERVIGSPELRALMLQFWRDWSLEAESGLTCLSADLATLHLALTGSPRPSRNRSRSKPLLPDSDSPAPPAQSFDSSDSQLYLEAETKAREGPEEDSEAEEDEAGPKEEPQPSQSQQLAEATKRTLLDLFMRASRLKSLPPNAIKKAFEERYRRHSQPAPEDAPPADHPLNRSQAVPRELFPSDDQANDDDDGEGQQGEDSEDSGAEGSDSEAEVDLPPPPPLHGILKRPDGDTPRRGPLSVQLPSDPQLRRTREGHPGNSSAWKDRFHQSLADRNRGSEEKGLSYLLSQV